MTHFFNQNITENQKPETKTQKNVEDQARSMESDYSVRKVVNRLGTREHLVCCIELPTENSKGRNAQQIGSL
jgi:hypothetical protein